MKTWWLGWIGLVCVMAYLTHWFLNQEKGWGPTAINQDITRLDSIGADVFFLHLPNLVKRGPARIVVVRLDHAAAFVPYHFETEKLSSPQTIEQWSTHLHAPIIFNAGQFDEKLHYLGWLKSQGTWLSQQRKNGWLALLVSGPVDRQHGLWARIIDLAHTEENIEIRYHNLIQSMMLVDDTAQVRVRNSDLAACRTIVAEDKQGRILIIVTEGAVTLYDMAAWLPTSDLHIVRAMNLDGGFESQLAIDTNELRMTLYGQYGTESTVIETRGQMVRYTLPAVIALRL